jgi:glucuronoarabinoxylan endo-1,4-beta-xylanase
MQEDLIHFSPIARLVKESALQRCRNVRWTRGRITDSTPTVRFFALKLTRAFFVVCYVALAGCGGTLISQSAGSGSAQTQTAAINWTNVHQIIDGFGASDAWESFSTEQSAFFFGTGTGQLGLSILRVAIPDSGGTPGSCATVGTGCANTSNDIQAVLSNGGRVIATPWSPPAQYKTNDTTSCTDNASLKSTDYGAYATWLANFALSLQQLNIPLYAIAMQNEPTGCGSTYDSAYYSPQQIDTFISQNLGPTLAANGLSTVVFMPDDMTYATALTSGGTCGTDLSCMQYVGAFAYHDYAASLSGTNTVSAQPYPSGWIGGEKFWVTENGCAAPPAVAPSFCQPGWNTDIIDALDWAAIIDQRIAVDNVNAWLYWWLMSKGDDDEGLIDTSGAVAQRAYMLGQYAKFVRPGYYRIDATRAPQTGVSVSAYQNTSTNTLVIIATNYTGSAVSQTFNITNAPTFSSLTPTITSSSLSLATQSSVSVSGNSFTYILPAKSITTFVGSASMP